MRLLLLTFVPIILSQFVYQLSGSVDNAMFGLIMENKGLNEAERLSLLGIYGGKYRLLTNVPVAVASSLGASMIPSIVASRVMKRSQEVKDKIYITIKFNMLLAIPLCRRNVCPGISGDASGVWGQQAADSRTAHAGILCSGFLFPVYCYKRCASGN